MSSMNMSCGDFPKHPYWNSPNPWVQPVQPWYVPKPVDMPGINTPWIPNAPKFVPAEPAPTLPPVIVLPSPELDELKKRVEELEKKLKKLSPPDIEVSGEPEIEKKRIVEP